MPETTDPVRHLLQTSKDDDRNPLGLGVRFQAFARLEPVHLRHLEIQPDEIGRLGIHAFERNATVLGGIHDEPPARKEVGNHRPVVGVVIDDQNTVFSHVWTADERFALNCSNLVRKRAFTCRKGLTRDAL